MRWQVPLAVLLLVSGVASAQTSPDTAPNPSQPERPAAPPPTPRVECVENLTPKDGTYRERPAAAAAPGSTAATKEEAAHSGLSATCDPQLVWSVRMDDALAIHVSGYGPWRAANKDAVLHLFVQGIELDNLQLRQAGSGDAATTDVLWTALKFEQSDAAKRGLWEQVLRMASRQDELSISVGEAGGPAWHSEGKIHLNLYPRGYTTFAVMILTGLLVGLVALGRKSNLLRDDNGAANPPYSLARHQMAVWFVVVVGAYLFVTMTTGVAAATSPTALILIGISGATGLVAVTLDASKRAAAKSDRVGLEAERVAVAGALDDQTTGLRAQLAASTPGSPEAVALTAAIATKTARLAELASLLSAAPVVPRGSVNWYLDLLSDDNGISFHRLQIAVWTLVLIGTFITAVLRTFAMPDFDATTLGLMGISSGTYLGFKLPERQP